MRPGRVEIAPGISRVRLAKLRPFNGIELSRSLVSESPVAVDSVCKIGATPVISTDCETSPTSSLISTFAI